MKKNKNNAFDWTIIQWARACDEERLVDVAKIDRELELERDEQGRLVDPELCLSERARRSLDSLGLSYRRQYESASSIKVFSCCLVVALGALVFPMARVERLLGDEVNLAGPFFFFVVGQVFFLSLSLALSCVLIIQAFCRRLCGKERPKTFGEKLVERLSNIVGEVVLFVLRKQISFARYLQKERPIESFFSRRRAQKESETREESREESIELKGRALFWDVLFSRPRFLFFWGGTLSQLFWTSCSFCVLIILGARMQSERYDYRWSTSLESRRVVMNVVKGLEPSVAWLGIEPLTKSDVESLFEEDGPALSKDAEPKNAANEELKEAEQEATQRESARARWSFFLLSVVFVWCVLPRAFLCVLNYSFYRFSLRDFRPKLDDPYFKKICESVELRPSRTESQIVKDDEEPFEAACLSSRAISSAPTTVYDEIVAKSNLRASFVHCAPAKKERDEETPSAPTEENAPASSETFEAKEQTPTSKETRQENANAPSLTSEGAKNVEDVSKRSVETRPEDVSTCLPQESSTFEKRANESKAPLKSRVAETSTSAAPASSKARRADFALALGYDASLRDELWRDLLPTRADVSIFGDVADDPANKKRLRALLQERGTSAVLCAFVTDASLPPARHFTRFLRDVLIPGAPNARFVVVLSGGEKLRQKFGANTSAVSERLADWKKTLEELAGETGAEITPTFFYDADLDLPEQRAKLRDLLRGRATKAKPEENEAKRTAASETIYRECLAIFESANYSPSEEESRLRVSNLCSRIFEIYRAEVERESSCGVRRLEAFGVGGSILTRLSSVASQLGGETLVRGGTALNEAIASASLEKGLDLHNIEKGLTFACGLSVRAKELCRKLSPKCAIAVGSVGLAAPVVVALAPVLGGAVSLSAIATSVAALGSALPSSLVGGALGGALGALTPLSLGACKKKLLEKIVGSKDPKERRESDDASKVPSTQQGDVESTTYDSEKIADVATLFCAATPWLAVLDLQRTSEEQIVELLPSVLEPAEKSNFESPKEIRKALDEIVENLQNIEVV